MRPPRIVALATVCLLVALHSLFCGLVLQCTRDAGGALTQAWLLVGWRADSSRWLQSCLHAKGRPRTSRGCARKWWLLLP
jgi:hypothetical protein